MAQFSKKVLATWAAVVVAEEIDLNLDESHVETVPETDKKDDLNLDDMNFDDEELDMNFGGHGGDDPMGGLGGLFGAFGGEPSDETKEIFKTHDLNGDGKLDAEEFSNFLGETMWEMSADQRGGKEYIEVSNATAESESEPGLKEMDKNGDGQISKEEYKAGVGGQSGDGFLEMLDSNKTGGLEIEEFGFIVNMFNMSKGADKSHEGHGHAHGDDHDHSTCGGHHGAKPAEEVEEKVEEKVEEHEHEHVHEDLTNASCSASNATEECCAGEECDTTPVDATPAADDLENASCAADVNSTSCCDGDACESAVVYDVVVEEKAEKAEDKVDDSHDEL